jgi:hypothetical protein
MCSPPHFEHAKSWLLLLLLVTDTTATFAGWFSGVFSATATTFFAGGSKLASSLASGML